MTHTLSAPTPKRWGLSASTLKLIACVFMVIDHVGAILLPDLLILRILGRISFPIFAYFIAEGCRYTRRKLKRFLLVFGLAVICEGVCVLVSGELEGGILVTFTFSILLIYEVQAIKRHLAERAWGKVFRMTFLLALSLTGVYLFIEHVVYVDYGFWGVLIPVLTALPDYKEGETPRFFRYLSGLPQKLAFCALGMLILCITRGFFDSIQTYCLLSLPLLALYNGTPGVKGFKYGFYIFYPAHLAILWLIAALLQS